MSFFAELKRRNVFRVGIAYVIVAWLVLQVADVVLNNITAPVWVFQVIMLVLAIGLPVVLVFAWAFELTPEGVKRESEVDRSTSIAPQTGKKLNNTILVLMALAIAYLLFDKFSGNRPDSVSTPAAVVAQSAQQPEAEPAPDSQPEISRQSIAVLPFDNRSPLAEDEYFTEGIHDDLLTNLSRIGSLKVISRTSVLRYKDTERSIPDIANELGVATIMEGAVQRSGNQVRINVQLIDAQTDEHLWAEIFDRELTAENLFAIQSEISQSIANALETTLSTEEQEQINTLPTQDLAAYEAYLRGRQLMATRNSQKLEEATQEFRTAVTLDPQFALAWVGLADSSMLRTQYSTYPVEEAIPIQENAIERALEINPSLGEAYVSLSQIHEHYNRPEEAEAALKRGIELSPNYATAWHWYGTFLFQFPLRAHEALEKLRRAAELDPGSLIVQMNLGGAYMFVGLGTAGKRQFEKVVELNPDFARGYLGLSFAEGFFNGRMDNAARYVQEATRRDPGDIESLYWLSSYFAELDDERSARQTLEQMETLDADHSRTALMTLDLSARFGTTAAARETLQWAATRVTRTDQALLAWYSLILGDTQQARQYYLRAEPGWENPDQWRRLIERDTSNACIVSWIFTHTNDAQMGAGLLQEALTFFAKDLPTVTEHVDFNNPEICYLAAGDTEQALAVIETQLAHNHLFGWDTWHRLPMYDKIRDEPRYQAAIAERKERLESQRIAVDAMTLETGT